MVNEKLLKIVGYISVAAGFGASILANWVGEQKMNNTVEEKVNEALAKKDKEESKNEGES